MKKLSKTSFLIASLIIIIAFVLTIKFTVWDSGHDIYLKNSYDDQAHSDQEIQEVVKKIISNYSSTIKYPKLTIIHPYNEAILPPEIASPTFTWHDENPDSKAWLIIISFKNGKNSIYVLSGKSEWIPDKDTWETIKANSMESAAEVTILGVDSKGAYEITARNRVAISTSKDEAGAPIFYMQIPLPFAYAIRHLKLSMWRLGDISSYKEPHTVLRDLPTCGNCHSFSRDGKMFGMDMDYKRDKGAYVLTPVRKKISLSKDDFISWNDIRISEKIPNMGLFSKISPDGKYVISTINEKPFMFVMDDLYFSQLFFPITGVLAYYSRKDKKFYLLPGADYPNYVQTSPAWSPDGKYIVFSRAEINKTLFEVMGTKRSIMVAPDVRIDKLNEQYQIHYDLYRIPFNQGRGGAPEPLMGACNNGMSNYFPRFSPDGKWIVFNQSETGLVAQPSSQLYIIPAEGGVARKMRCNTDLYNSWHSWSPNGRWMVFSSKVNTPYTEIFITHIDENGNDSPPALLSRFSSKDHASIMPEFVNIKPNAIKEIKLMDSK